MSSRVYRHPTLPAVIRIYGSNFNPMQYSESSNLEDIALLDVQPERVYLIIDVSDMPISVEDMIQAASVMGRTESGQKKYHHPNVIENLMIVKQRMVEIAVQNLKMPSMGSIQLKTFGSLDAALEYVQEQQSVSS